MRWGERAQHRHLRSSSDDEESLASPIAAAHLLRHVTQRCRSTHAIVASRESRAMRFGLRVRGTAPTTGSRAPTVQHEGSLTKAMTWFMATATGLPSDQMARRTATRRRSRTAAAAVQPGSIMTSRIRTSTYKGSSVTVRWQELKRADPLGSLFIAGYALTSGHGTQTDWLQFNSPTFHSHDTAVAHALGEAHRFIDRARSRSAHQSGGVADRGATNL